MPEVVTSDYAQEILSDSLWSEMTPLLQRHYEEIAHFPELPLDPDRAAYTRIEANGCLRIFTARADGVLVGYLVLFVAPSMHIRAVQATSDQCYVVPEQRGLRHFVNLCKLAHDVLRQEGVTTLYQHVKAKPGLNFGKLLKRLFAYELVDEVWALRLDKGE